MTILIDSDNQIQNPRAFAFESLKTLQITEEVHILEAQACTFKKTLDEEQSPSEMELLSLDVEGYKN